MRLEDLPDLGVGIGFREPLLGQLMRHQKDVDFLEIVADRYLDASGDKRRELELLSRHFPLVPHAINLSLGSAEGVDPDYLAMLAELIEGLEPPWWSEHIAFTRAGSTDIGHLSPLPYTREALDLICRNIDLVRQRIHTPLILENITYTVSFPFAEMDEVTFLNKILERTDCGLLLDVTNLFTNSTNHRYDPIAFLQQLPAERVVQLHFAGGYWHNGTLVDSHSEPTPPEVWKLMGSVLERHPVKGVLLERDQNLPPFSELLDELNQVRRLKEGQGQWA